jgi:hypothetical protein
MSPRYFLVFALALVATLPARAADVKMDEPTKKAVARGLEWLAGAVSQ